ncbi:MAG TPA: hypothetical protein V6D23_05135 [Candidatus Obscuribacterales bacterium]
MINLHRLCGLALGAMLLLPGCMSRMVEEPQDQAGAEAVIRTFLTDLLEEDGKGLMQSISLPFWTEEEWIVDSKTLQEELPDDGPQEIPMLGEIVVRIYPLADMAVLEPKSWANLKDSNPAYLKDLYVAAVALRERSDRDPESGLVLLRRVNGSWRLAGLLDH